jgi:hypothetical protein
MTLQVPGLGQVVARWFCMMQISLNVKRDCAVGAHAESRYRKSQDKNAGQFHPEQTPQQMDCVPCVRPREPHLLPKTVYSTRYGRSM